MAARSFCPSPADLMTDSYNILVIERTDARGRSLTPALRKKGFRVSAVSSVQEALEGQALQRADLVILDAASMKTSGVRMARQLRRALNGTPLLHLCLQGVSPFGRQDADALLIHPFTPRKLLNRVRRLLPADERHEVCAGPIRLDTVNRVVRCHGNRARLTTKLAELLKLLMQRSGQLVTREELMRRVWRTDYTGDMRTIDVHISWLRKAIEPNPASPRYLKTVRGQGYCLDLPLSGS